MRAFAGWVGLISLIFAPCVVSAQTNGDDNLETIISLKVLSDFAILTKKWCDLRVPDGAAAHDLALQSWQSEFRTDEVARIYADRTGRPDADPALSGDGIFPKFDTEYPDAKVVCAGLETFLFTNFDLRKVAGEDYTLIMKQGTTGQAEAPPEPEQAQNTNEAGDWGYIDADRAAERLAEAGAKLPVRLGGELQPGSYDCRQNRFFGGDTKSAVDYLLLVYGDESLRVKTYAVMLDGSTGFGGEYLGIYGYNTQTTEFNVAEWDYDSYDIEKFHFFNGVYDAVGDDPDLYGAFRVVTDAAGKQFFYGFMEYGNPFDSVTVCSPNGNNPGLSPRQVQMVAGAEKDAERYKYRTDPGKGLRLDQIEGYLYTSSYETRIGGGDPITEDADLMLKDGWIYGAPDYSPHDFAAEPSKRGEPRNWYHWKRDGAQIMTSMDGENWTASDGIIGLPIAPEDLIGTFETMVVYGDGMATERVIKTRSWSFGADGTFRYGTTSKAAGFFDSTESTGTYRVDGYTLDLTYDDDGSIWRTFVLTWGGDAKNVIVAGETFSRP